MLIFISFIVMFASAYFWRRGTFGSRNLTLKLSGEENRPKRRHAKRKRKTTPAAAPSPDSVKTIDSPSTNMAEDKKDQV